MLHTGPLKGIYCKDWSTDFFFFFSTGFFKPCCSDDQASPVFVFASK